MNTKRRSLLVNLNRVLIFALTILGLLIDGLQTADLSYGIALVIWLWLPHCTRIEEKVLTRISTNSRHFPGPAKMASRLPGVPQ